MAYQKPAPAGVGPPLCLPRLLAPVQVLPLHGKAGEQLVAYDNEPGKGDHRHYGGRDEVYDFISVHQLVADFEADIEILRGAPR